MEGRRDNRPAWMTKKEKDENDAAPSVDTKVDLRAFYFICLIHFSLAFVHAQEEPKKRSRSPVRDEEKSKDDVKGDGDKSKDREKDRETRRCSNDFFIHPPSPTIAHPHALFLNLPTCRHHKEVVFPGAAAAQLVTRPQGGSRGPPPLAIARPPPKPLPRPPHALAGTPKPLA